LAPAIISEGASEDTASADRFSLKRFGSDVSHCANCLCFISKGAAIKNAIAFEMATAKRNQASPPPSNTDLIEYMTV